MVKVSVIMPSLNVVDYIEEAIQSVRIQTLSDIEIICIDAGSTDGTWEIIKKNADEDKRIIAIQSPVRSYGFQVNMGIRVSKGEYVGILETDDFVSEQMYEKLYEKACLNNTDYVKCDYATYTTDRMRNKYFIDRIISRDEIFYNQPFCPKDYQRVVVDDWYVWNGIYKLDFLRENEIFFSETSGAAFQDIGFLHRVAAKARTGIFFHQSLYRYCVDRAEASSNSCKSLHFIRKEYGILLDETEEKKDTKEKHLLYTRMVRSFVSACMESSDEVLLQRESEEICDWFQRRIHEARRWGFVNEEYIPKGLLGGYRHLVCPAEGFVSYRKERIRELYDFLKRSKTIMVFGCGMFGKEARNYLKNIGYDVYGFLDNNSVLWGEKVDGLEVFNPSEYIERDGYSFIVANEKYAEDISAQILTVKKDAQIFIYTAEFRCLSR